MSGLLLNIRKCGNDRTQSVEIARQVAVNPDIRPNVGTMVENGGSAAHKLGGKGEGSFGGGRFSPRILNALSLAA